VDSTIHTTPKLSAVELNTKLMLFAGYSFQATEQAGTDLAGRAREKADLIQKALKLLVQTNSKLFPKDETSRIEIMYLPEVIHVRCCFTRGSLFRFLIKKSSLVILESSLHFLMHFF